MVNRVKSTQPDILYFISQWASYLFMLVVYVLTSRTVPRILFILFAKSSIIIFKLTLDNPLEDMNGLVHCAR